MPFLATKDVASLAAEDNSSTNNVDSSKLTRMVTFADDEAPNDDEVDISQLSRIATAAAQQRVASLAGQELTGDAPADSPELSKLVKVASAATQRYPDPVPVPRDIPRDTPRDNTDLSKLARIASVAARQKVTSLDGQELTGDAPRDSPELSKLVKVASAAAQRYPEPAQSALDDNSNLSELARIASAIAQQKVASLAGQELTGDAPRDSPELSKLLRVASAATQRYPESTGQDAPRNEGDLSDLVRIATSASQRPPISATQADQRDDGDSPELLRIASRVTQRKPSSSAKDDDSPELLRIASRVTQRDLPPTQNGHRNEGDLSDLVKIVSRAPQQNSNLATQNGSSNSGDSPDLLRIASRVTQRNTPPAAQNGQSNEGDLSDLIKIVSKAPPQTSAAAVQSAMKNDGELSDVVKMTSRAQGPPPAAQNGQGNEGDLSDLVKIISRAPPKASTSTTQHDSSDDGDSPDLLRIASRVTQRNPSVAVQNGQSNGGDLSDLVKIISRAPQQSSNLAIQTPLTNEGDLSDLVKIVSRAPPQAPESSGQGADIDDNELSQLTQIASAVAQQKVASLAGQELPGDAPQDNPELSKLLRVASAATQRYPDPAPQSTPGDNSEMSQFSRIASVAQADVPSDNSEFSQLLRVASAAAQQKVASLVDQELTGDAPSDSAELSTLHRVATAAAQNNKAISATQDSPRESVDLSKMFRVSIKAHAALVEFSSGHRHNPFSQPKMGELVSVLKQLDTNDSVGCIVLTGGKGRSFSVGGDFGETSSFVGGDEVDTWIDTFTELYTTIAGISKPVIAAIDGYAIGLGLQIALCCDYRLGSDECNLIMSELRMGIACSFGGYMLEQTVGRSVMQKMVFTADRWNAAAGLKNGVLHEVVPSNDLVARALERAEALGSWSPSAVRQTRSNINAAFIEGLLSISKQARISHRKTFAGGDAQVTMKHIITKNQKKPPWTMITNATVPAFAEQLIGSKGSGVRVYGQNADSLLDMVISLDESPITKKGSDWSTSIEVKNGFAAVKTGPMNSPPLYIVRHETVDAKKSWAIGTDSFMLNVVCSQWGDRTGFTDLASIHLDETTSFQGVSQLPPNSYWRTEKSTSDSDWRTVKQQLDDPLQKLFSPQIDDFEQAGLMFIASLRKAISEMTTDGETVAVLLSGGIDSGAVATFAHMAGLKVTAYSAGSPWGNEHSEAKELTDFLGIPHVYIDLSTEQMLEAIPATARTLPTADQERIDVLVTISAVMRSGIIKESHILTGLGSDLLNLGLPLESHDISVDDLLRDIYDGIEVTRHSGEFTDNMAKIWGKKLSHPYWHKDVVQTALNIHPARKIQNGREKAFFRAAMEPYVPMTTAWRKKIGIHLGGGLQGGLDATFGGRERKIAAYCEIYKSIANRLLKDPFADIDDLAPKISEADGIAYPTNATPQRKELTTSGGGVAI